MDFEPSASPTSESGGPTHDDLIKAFLALPRLLVLFFRAFLPDAFEFADFSEIEYLDKEHSRAGGLPKRIGDLLVKVKWRGQDAAFLVHIESQASAESHALERVAEYAYRDAIRYGLPVMPVLLVTYPTPERPQAGDLDWTFGELAFLRVRCPVLQFRLMDPAPHLVGGNVAALALSSLMRLDREQQVEVIVQTLAEALRADLSAAELEAVSAFVRHYAPLDAEQLLQLRERVSKLSSENEALHAMPTLVNPFVELGKLEGRAEGRAEGERLLTLRLLNRKFPGIAEEVAAKLKSLDEAALLAFGEALLFFETEAECLGWFEEK